MSALPVAEFARRAAALGERLNADAPTSWRPDKPELEHPRVLVGVLVGQEPSPSVGYEGSPCSGVRMTAIVVERGDFLIAVISPDSVQSGWCRTEVASYRPGKSGRT